MIVNEDFLFPCEEKQKSSDWVYDSVYKKKLNCLLSDLEKRDFVITHLPNGDIDAFYFKVFKVRYSWCTNNSRFLRMRSNSRNHKNRKETEEDFNC